MLYFVKLSVREITVSATTILWQMEAKFMFMKRADSNTPLHCVDAVELALSPMLYGLLQTVNSGFECHCLLSFSLLLLYIIISLLFRKPYLINLLEIQLAYLKSGFF
jgi:hypothetical protein